MSWFKFDDNAVDHPKLASLTDRAFRWWVKGLSYACRFLTDGVLHPTFWKHVPKQCRAELTGAKLWDWEDPNFQIHDYLHHQIGKHEIEQDKERNREKAKAYRERRRTDRRKPVTGNVTDTLAGDVTDHITDIDNPTHIPNTLQTQSKTPPAPVSKKPLISGQANPRDWGRIHGNHVSGFCDWVCLPDFVFEEFRGKSPGPEYVKGWAAKVREKWEGQTIGEDGLKFWRARWSESHVTKPVAKPFSITEALAREEARRAGKVS
jgi:hypothetical protein